MNQIPQSSREIPEIVRIVLEQAVRTLRAGNISQDIFDQQLHRLCREELAPRQLELLTRELPDGGTRFLIKSISSGRVCDLMEFAPAVADV